jgi:hypothetical protein
VNSITNRHAQGTLAIFLAMAMSCILLVPARFASGNIDSKQAPVDHVLQFSSDGAWAHLETLMGYQPRYPGTLGINQSVTYIESTLQARGGTVAEQPFTTNGVPCKNIIGKWGPRQCIGQHRDPRQSLRCTGKGKCRPRC